MKNFYCYFLFLFLISCSKDNLIEKDQLNLVESVPLVKSYPGDGKYDVLGYSCDITSNMFYAKAEIVNNDKLEATYPSPIYKNENQSSYAYYNAGATASSYLQAITRSKSINISASFGPATCTGNIKDYFKDSTSLSTRFSYANYEKVIQKREYTYNVNIEQLRNCLSYWFLYDLNTNFDANRIVGKYGTHVYNNVKVGGKLKFTYQAEISNSFYSTETSKTRAVTVGMATLLKKVSVSPGITISEQERIQIEQETRSGTCVIKTEGGNSSIPFEGISLDAKNPNYTVNSAEWERSVTIGNQTTLVDFNANSLIPIWELVSDPSKRAMLKAAVENHIAKNILRDYVAKVPLYRFYIPGNKGYSYSIDKDTQYALGGRLEGVAGYVCSYGAKGTIPLHTYYNTKYKDYTYTVVRDDNHYNRQGYAYIRLECYVPSSETIGAVPFHCYKLEGNPTRHYYTTKDSQGYRPAGYPSYYGITCHVFSLQGETDKSLPNVSKVPLYRFYLPSNNGYSYSIDRDTQYALGGRLEGVAGYVYSYNASGTLPLYTYYNAKYKDYTSTILRDDAHYNKHGYVYTRLECYVPSAGTAGAIPFYCYKLNGNPTRHYYTTRSSQGYRPSGYPDYLGITCHVFGSN